MEGARGDEQDVVGADGTVLGRHLRALDQRQQVALHALAADIGTLAVGAGGDLVDFVEEHDAVLFDRFDGKLHHLVLVDQLVAFLGDQHAVGIGNRRAPRLLPPAHCLAEHLVEIDHTDRRTGHAGQIEGRQTALPVLHLDLDFLVVELAAPQHFAELLARLGPGAVADQRIDHALFGGKLGARGHLPAQPVARLGDRDLDQIAHDLLDVAADIADLGELGRLHLEERRVGKLRKTARDLGLADTGRADHQDVLRQHFLAQGGIEFLPAPAIAQRDRDSALGVVLADDMAVEFGDDLARTERALVFRSGTRWRSGCRLFRGFDLVHRISTVRFSLV
jgi:hypothetical protein